MLPDMDGWELLSRLNQVPDLRRIPVVIISIGSDRSKGFALGAAAVMQKPVSRQELYESLVDLRLLPRAPGSTLRVLVVDDDPRGGGADRRARPGPGQRPSCARTAAARRSISPGGSCRT